MDDDRRYGEGVVWRGDEWLGNAAYALLPDGTGYVSFDTPDAASVGDLLTLELAHGDRVQVEVTRRINAAFAVLRVFARAH